MQELNDAALVSIRRFALLELVKTHLAMGGTFFSQRDIIYMPRNTHCMRQEPRLEEDDTNLGRRGECYKGRISLVRYS